MWGKSKTDVTASLIQFLNNFSDTTRILIFFTEKRLVTEKTQELFCLKMKGEFENNFHLGKSINVSVENIKVNAWTHATVESQNSFCIKKCTPLLIVLWTDSKTEVRLNSMQ